MQHVPTRACGINRGRLLYGLRSGPYDRRFVPLTAARVWTVVPVGTSVTFWCDGLWTCSCTVGVAFVTVTFRQAPAVAAYVALPLYRTMKDIDPDTSVDHGNDVTSALPPDSVVAVLSPWMKPLQVPPS